MQNLIYLPCIQKNSLLKLKNNYYHLKVLLLIQIFNKKKEKKNNIKAYLNL